MHSALLPLAREDVATSDFASLSVEGGWLVVEQRDIDGWVWFSFVDLNADRIVETREFEALSNDTIESLRWLDDRRMLLDTADSDTWTTQLYVMELADDDRHQLTEVGSTYAGAQEVSPDGNWVARMPNDGSRVQVLPFEGGDLGDVAGEVKGDFTPPSWSMDSELLVAFGSSNPDGGGFLVASFRVAPTFSVLPIFQAPTWDRLSTEGDLRYIENGSSRVSDSLPLYSVEHGVTQVVTLPEGTWEWVIRGTKAPTALFRSDGKLAVAPLLDADGTPLEEPKAQIVADFGESFCNIHWEASPVRDDREIVCHVSTSYEDGGGELYWFNLEDPKGSLTELTEVLGSDTLVSYALSQMGDYVALAAAERVYVVSLEQPFNCQVIEGVESGEAVVWAPGDSGLILTTSAHNGRVYFVPRTSKGEAWFDKVQSTALHAEDALVGLSANVPPRWP